MSTLQTIAIIMGVLSSLAGVFGFFLGIANHVRLRNAARPRIVVRPRVYNLLRSDTAEITEKNAAIMEICNVGQWPVIGSAIGFLPRWGVIGSTLTFLLRRQMIGAAITFLLRRERIRAIFQYLHRRGQGEETTFLAPDSLNDVKLTDELKPQHVAMLRFTLEGLPETRKLGRAFVRTIVGDVFRASRRDMREFAKERKAAST